MDIPMSFDGGVIVTGDYIDPGAEQGPGLSEFSNPSLGLGVAPDFGAREPGGAGVNWGDKHIHLTIGGRVSPPAVPPNPFAQNTPFTLGLPAIQQSPATYFLGLNISLIAPFGGFTASYGYYFNPATLALGTYYSWGTGTGVDIAASLTGGYINGTVEQFKGAFDNFNFEPWYLEGSVHLDTSGQYLGSSFGVGFPPWGWSQTWTKTGLLPIDSSVLGPQLVPDSR
jgi:hypothetical protein